MKYWILLCLTLSIMLWTGCATSNFGWKTETPVETPETVEETEFVEDFDPLSLEDEEIVVPQQSAEASDLIDPPASVGPPAQSDPGELPEEELVDGYRVQLLATKNQDAAFAEKRRVMMRITDHKVYLPYIQSMYRLRVGDFLTPQAARAYAEELKRRGMDAFVARDRIDPRRAPDKP